jgi:hypothetical protein
VEGEKEKERRATKVSRGLPKELALDITLCPLPSKLLSFNNFEKSEFIVDLYKGIADA